MVINFFRQEIKNGRITTEQIFELWKSNEGKESKKLLNKVIDIFKNVFGLLVQVMKSNILSK
jgi:hypothetical protein